MALADYRLCDVCQDKAFYDSELSYDFKEYPDTGLYNVGAWGVLCRDCIKTHRVVILPVEVQHAPAGVALPLPNLSDAQIRVFAEALGMWVEPHEAERESGVEIECGISPEDAEQHNAGFVATIREAWAHAFGVKEVPRG